MAEERCLLIISPDKLIRGFAPDFVRAGWKVETAASLAEGMRRFDASPSGFNLVIMDEDHGCENGAFRDVLSGLREIRHLNEECKILFLATPKTRSKAEMTESREWADGIVTRKKSVAAVLAWSAKLVK